jgi:hypothetical protein
VTAKVEVPSNQMVQTRRLNREDLLLASKEQFRLRLVPSTGFQQEDPGDLPRTFLASLRKAVFLIDVSPLYSMFITHNMYVDVFFFSISCSREGGFTANKE